MAGVARSALSPQVNGNLSIERQHWPDNDYYGPGPLANANTWNNTGTLGLSYHLDLWGKDKNAAETRARHRPRQRRRRTRRAARTRSERGACVYRHVDELRAARYRQGHARSSSSRSSISPRAVCKGGLGTQLEVSQAETPVPEYERQIDELEEQIALGRNQLAALAGKGPGAGDSITRPTLALNAPAGLPSALPAELLGHRPDIVAARWTVAAQARGIDVAKANFYPDINLLASIGGYAAAGPLFQFLRAANGSWTGGPGAVAADLRRRPAALATRRRGCGLRRGGRAVQPDDRQRAEGRGRSGRAHPFARDAGRRCRALGRRRAQEL